MNRVIREAFKNKQPAYISMSYDLGELPVTDTSPEDNGEAIMVSQNNNGYIVERALELNSNPEYDDLAQLNYSLLPHAFGCKSWLGIKVSTPAELADAMIKARAHPSGVYIEMITGIYDYGATLQYLHNHIKDLYS